MTQKEQENFLKNAILIVDHTKTALIALVDLDLQNKSLSFEKFLNKNQHEAYHLCCNRGKCCQCVPSYMLPSVRIIYPAQLELLYDKLSPKLPCHGRILRLRTLPPVCCSLAQTGISTNILDISLARCILTNFCHEVFWYSCLQFKRKSLEDFLNSNKHTIYHLLNNNTSCCLCPSGFVFPCDRPQITQTEWNNMFSSLMLPCTNDRKRSYNGTTSICSVSATPGISIHHLDLKLQDVLLRYCCPLMKSVIDLVDIRNVRYGHVQEARMSDADYKKVFQEIENNLMPIASVCGNIGVVKQNLHDLQNRTLDETLCLQYQNSLLEHLRYVNETKDNIEICCKEVKTSVRKLGKDFSKKMSKLANEQTVEAVATEVKIRIPRKLDKYYMQSSRQQHYVAKLARQCNDKSKEVEQQIDSVVESIGDFKINMDTRFDTVENTVEIVSKNVEELAIRIPEIVEKCIDEKGLTMLEIDNHSKENTFVTTSVVSSCVKLLKDNDVLVLTGRAGSGKSRNSLEILRQYKVDGYDVIKLSDLKDFEDSFKGDVETIFLCEDIFGRTNNVFTKNSDVKILDRVHACVNMGKTKVIFTIRDIVKRSCEREFSSYRLFYKSVEVDLCSKELELKLEEKKLLFVRYCSVNNFKIVGLNEQENLKDEVILDNKVTVKLNLITLNQIIQTDPILGFPQTCCLFTGNRKFTRLGEAFFKHPSSCLTEEIENLRKSGIDKFSDKIKYSLLVYVVVNGDFLDKNQMNSNQVGDIMVSCYHNEINTISEHDLIDAIDAMIGQYLIKGYDTNSYQFQHQTVLESVLISYNRINPELILSKLAFNFIREMVRLAGYKEKEGEIVMKIPAKYYSKLCERILEILESEYCLRSQNLIQLLCDSEIMRQNDLTFVKSLIEVAHRVLPLKNTTTIIALPDDHESVYFYLPAALLEHVITQKHLSESSVQLLEHTRYIIQRESKIDIVQSCKASVLSAFLSSVIQEHSDEIVTLILNIINDFNLTDDNDTYFTKVILLTPPRNEKMMMLLLRIIDLKYVDLQKIFLEICLRNWKNILPLLKKDTRTSGIDLTGTIGDLCRSGRYEVVKWLVHIIELSYKLVNENINANNEEVFQWFCDNVDKGKFNMQTAISEICETGNIEVVQWLIQNYNSTTFFDVKIALNASCRGGNINIARWLIKNTDTSYFDLNMAILEACNSNKHDVISLIVDSINPFSFDMNILVIMVKRGLKKIVEQLLHIVSAVVLPEIIDFAKQAFTNEKLEIIQWLIENLQSSTVTYSYNLKSALNNACKGKETTTVVEYLLHNVAHTRLDMRTAIDIAIDGNNLDIVKLLLNNDSHRSIDVNRVMIDACRFDGSKLIEIINVLLANIDQTFFDIETIKKIFHYACRKAELDIIKILVKHFDNKLLDMKTAMTNACFNDNVEEVRSIAEYFDNACLYTNTSLILDQLKIMKSLADTDNHVLGIDTVTNNTCSEGNFTAVQLIAENVDTTLFDVKTALEYAIGDDVKDDDYRNFDLINFLLNRLEDEDMSKITNLNKLMSLVCYNFNCQAVQLLTEKVDTSLLGIDTVMNRACSTGRFDVVKWLVENVDNTLFDVKTALEYAIGDDKEDEEDEENDDGDEYFDFKIIDLLLKRCIEEDVLPYITNLKRFMILSCFNFHEVIMQLLIIKVDTSLLGIDTVMYGACSTGRFDVVKWLVENVDNTLFDVKTALEYAIGEDKEDEEDEENEEDEEDEEDEYFDFKIIDLLLKRCIEEDVLSYITNLKRFMRLSCFNFHEVIMQLLIEKVDTSLLGVDTVMNQACSKDRFDVVKWLVINVDNTLFDVKTALNYVIDKPGYHHFYEHDEIIDLLLQSVVENVWRFTKNIKKLMRYLYLRCDKDKMQLLIEKVDNSLLGIDTVMNEACLKGDNDEVKWLVEHVDNTVFDVKKVLEYAIGKDEENDEDDYGFYDLGIIDILLRRCNKEDVLPYINKLTSLRGVDTVMNEACSEGMTYLVKWLVEHNDNTLLNFNTAISTVCSRPDCLDLAMWLLANIDDKEFDVNTTCINACSNGNLDLLNWLLETSGRQHFDAKTALNVSCINGHSSTVKYLLENFDIQHFDLATAIIKVCRSHSKDSVEIGKCLWNKFNHNVFDLAKAMNNACRYGNLDVAKWLFEMTNIDVFDMSEALNSACQCDKDVVVKWIISNIPTEKFNVQIAIKYACRNHSNNLSIIKCFVKSSGKINLDLNILVKEACTYERTDVIEWMLENCDKDSFRILDLLTSLVNIDNSLEINVIDNHDKSTRDSKKQNLILKILKNNTYLSCDYNSILSRACSEGWIDIFRWILTKIDNTELNITDAVNIASQNGRCELINWSLSNLNPHQIDANTILVEASGFGFIEVVQSISSRPDKCKLNFKNAMNDACEYGRGEVVTWLLKNNAKDVFDLSMVMSAACRNGWMDTLNCILENADYMLINIDDAIIEACAAGNINIVRLLFSTFDKKLFDQQKLSARICEKGCNEKVVLFLLENLNADVFQMDNILNKASGFGWLEVVSWIMENGPEINTVGSAFENACVNCEIDIVKYLQDKISQENIQTGLQTACKSGFEEIVEVLLDCLNHEQIDIATLLNEACRCGEQTVVEVLLRKVDNALFDKRAAINEACRSKLPEELVYFLIKDLQKNDFDNEVVSENARKHSWTKVLMQLKRKS